MTAKGNPAPAPSDLGCAMPVLGLNFLLLLAYDHQVPRFYLHGLRFADCGRSEEICAVSIWVDNILFLTRIIEVVVEQFPTAISAVPYAHGLREILIGSCQFRAFENFVNQLAL